MDVDAGGRRSTHVRMITFRGCFGCSFLHCSRQRYEVVHTRIIEAFDLAMALGRVEFYHPICSQGTLGNCYVSWLKPMLVAILVACM